VDTLDWSHTVLDTAPAAEPVTKAWMKEHLPLDGTDHDDLLDRYIAAARRLVEGHTKKQLISATWLLKMSSFPAEILVPYPPLQSVTHLKYYDTGGDQQTLTKTTDYQIDLTSEPGRVKPAYGKSWPAIRSDNYESVELKFVAGYGDAGTDVPESLVAAVQITAAMMFRYRDEDMPMPEQAQRLLNLETAELFA
jgi:uncharacterized phiE125 gp8 family phage protein